MTGTSGVPADSPDAEAADNQSEAKAAVGADKWAKAVVDGLRSDTTGSADKAGNSEGSDDSWWVEEPDENATDDPHPTGAEAVDPEVVDAEVIDAELVDDDDIVVDDLAVDDIAVDDIAVDNTVVDEPADATAAAGSADEENPAGDISVEDLVIDLERVTTERDQYLDASRRLQAEFENYKKQVVKREAEARERANDSLVGELLPVLDAFDGALANGAENVAPMRTSFLDAMAKQGLERIDPIDAPFDPTLHEAVMHEDASDTDGPVVAEVMRAGYVWKGRVLRPAMVRTRG